MQQFSDIVLSRSGVVQPGIPVSVKTIAGALATIYLDGAGTQAANPVITDANGVFSFYAPDGTYNLFVGSTFAKQAQVYDASGGTYTQAGTGALNRTVQEKLREAVSLADFAGFDGSGATASDTAIASAIACLPSGGIIRVPVGSKVLWTTAVVANQPIMFDADVRRDITANTNGSNASAPLFVWGGASGATMFTVQPATSGDVIWGGGSRNIEWDGNALAATAVHLNNTKYATFDGKVRNVTTSAVMASSMRGSASNFSQLNTIDLEFVWGTSAACQNAHGVVLKGNGVDAPATQQRVKRATGLIYNGSMIQIAETDNCSIGCVNAAVQSGGSGRALELKAGGAQNANHNIVLHISGPIKQDSGLIGNKFLHNVSEGGGITQTSGSARWDGELTDYVTGRVYESHKYALRKKISLPSSALRVNSETSSGRYSLLWEAITLPKAQPAPEVQAFLPPDFDLSNGTIEGVEVVIGTNGTSGGNINLTLGFMLNQPGSNFVTPQQTPTQTFAAPAQYNSSVLAFTFSQAFTQGDMMALRVTRNSGAGADTNTDDIFVLGVRVLYVSAGPDSAGSGTYYIPAWA